MTLHALLIATFLSEDGLQAHFQADLAEHTTSPHKNATCRERETSLCVHERYVKNSSVCGYCFRNPFVDIDLTSLLFSCLPTIDSIGQSYFISLACLVGVFTHSVTCQGEFRFTASCYPGCYGNKLWVSSCTGFNSQPFINFHVYRLLISVWFPPHLLQPPPLQACE